MFIRDFNDFIVLSFYYSSHVFFVILMILLFYKMLNYINIKYFYYILCFICLKCVLTYQHLKQRIREDVDLLFYDRVYNMYLYAPTMRMIRLLPS